MGNLIKIYARLSSFALYNLLLFGNFILVLVIKFDLYNNNFPLAALYLSIAYLLTGIGAYFFNDLMDVKSDIKVKKISLMQIVDKKIVIAIVFVLWFAGYWLVNLITPKIVIYYVLQLTFILFYSIPIIRLKEKGILGVIVDAGYAHIIPIIMLLALANSFIEMNIIFAIILIAIAFFTGMRDILIHQMNDLENDRKSGTVTFASTNFILTSKLIWAFEIGIVVALFLLVINLGFYNYKGLCLIMFLSLSAYYIVSYSKKVNVLTDNVSLRGYIILSSIAWLGLIINSGQYWLAIFLVHPYFISFLVKGSNKIYLMIKWIFKIIIGNLLIQYIPLFVNYFLYYLFLLFGRNIKERPLYNNQNEIKFIKWVRMLFN